MYLINLYSISVVCNILEIRMSLCVTLSFRREEIRKWLGSYNFKKIIIFWSYMIISKHSRLEKPMLIQAYCAVKVLEVDIGTNCLACHLCLLLNCSGGLHRASILLKQLWQDSLACT